MYVFRYFSIVQMVHEWSLVRMDIICIEHIFWIKHSKFILYVVVCQLNHLDFLTRMIGSEQLFVEIVCLKKRLHRLKENKTICVLM